MAMCMKSVRSVAARAPRTAVKAQASLGANVARAAGLGLASLGLALSAQAATVKMGSDNGALVFEPQSITIAKGETVTFLNNMAGPHNAVFDEENIPAGVDGDALTFDPVNAPGGKVDVTFDTPGTYNYYCQPHEASLMKGSIVVQ